MTLIVRDVEKMGHFLKTICDAEEVYDNARKDFSISQEKFFVVGGIWIAVMEGEPLAERSYDHLTFKVPGSEFAEYVSRVRQLGVDIRPGRHRVSAEGRSIYFYDYDNHLFELHTGTLDERLQYYSRGERPLQQKHAADGSLRVRQAPQRESEERSSTDEDRGCSVHYDRLELY